MDTFMQMDFLTFGNQRFTNLPTDLFSGSTEYNRLDIADVKFENQDNGKFLYVTACTTVHYCVHGHGTSNCDYGNCTCGTPLKCFLTTSCNTITVWVDDPTGSGLPGGGGGGGVPGPQPPIDPCTNGLGVFYRMAPGCLGGGDNDLPLLTPCRKLKDLFSPLKANVKPLITNGMYSYIDNSSTGEGGIYVKKDAQGNITTEIAPYTADEQVPIKSSALYYSAIHTHPKSAYPMFSWTDIYNLYLLEMNAALPFNRNHSSFLLVCEDENGVKQTYAIVFEDIGSMMEDVLNNPKYAGCTPLEICKEMDDKLKLKYDEEINKDNPNYERVFLQFNFGTNIGLYKANSDLTNWSKLSINEDSDTAIVNSNDCN